MRPLVGAAWGVVVALVGHGCLSRRPARARPAARRSRSGSLAGEIPLVADLLAVALAGGLTPYLALELTARAGPPVAGGHLAAVLSRLAGGRRLADALEEEAAAVPALRELVEILLLSERTGSPVAPLLAALAASGRDASRRAALTWARRVPVRLLFPLVFLILPAFLLLTVTPVLLAGLH